MINEFYDVTKKKHLYYSKIELGSQRYLAKSFLIHANFHNPILSLLKIDVHHLYNNFKHKHFVGRIEYMDIIKLFA